MASVTGTRSSIDGSQSLVKSNRRSQLAGRYATSMLRYAILIPLALLFLFPFYIMIRNGLMTQREVASDVWLWWPADTQWSNYKTVMDDPLAPMWTGLRNSALLAGFTLVFQTLFASMAGYALARVPARGSNVAFFVILSTLMVPTAVTFIPGFLVINKLGGIGELWGVIIPGLFSAFATFLFRQFYLDFPVEIEEAASSMGWVTSACTGR